MMTTEQALKWMELFNEKVQENSNHLNDLDTPIGDGDHGANMARGLKAVMETLETKKPEDAAGVFKAASMQMLSKVGGASGPLYWSAFSGIAKSLKNEATLEEALENGLEEIKKRGKSEAGQKTMIDTWAPVIESLKENNLTKEKIAEDVEKTKDILATKGRASYLGERSLGHVDPGAYSSGLFFEAMLEAEVK